MTICTISAQKKTNERQNAFLFYACVIRIRTRFGGRIERFGRILQKFCTDFFPLQFYIRVEILEV